MGLYAVIIPGISIVTAEAGYGSVAESQLFHLTSEYITANEALISFDEARADLLSELESFSVEGFGHANARRAEIERELEEHYPSDLTFEGREVIRTKAELLYAKEKWEHGVVPRAMLQARVQIFARAFLSAVDMFSKMLDVMVKDARSPASLKPLQKEMKNILPDAREVRNTVQHLDERMQGLGHGSKPLKYKPIKNDSFDLPSGALVLGHISGNKYGSTMGSGKYGEVSISSETMVKLQIIFTKILSAYEWGGPSRIVPD